MELSPEKLLQLKRIVQEQLADINIQSHIEEAITNVIPEHDTAVDSENHILEDLKRKGVVEEILEKLELDSSQAKEHKDRDKDEHIKKALKVPSCRYLYLQILRGRAFLEHLNAPANSNPSSFKIHVHFRGQRFHSKCVPVACEPDFSEGFLLELKTSKVCPSTNLLSSESLLSICDPVHLLLMREDDDGSSTLVSSHALEWRSALNFNDGAMNSTIELMGVGPECKVPAGVLEVQMQVLPSHKMLAVDPKVIEAQLHLEKQRCSERERLFLAYAKQWWREYAQLRDEHKSRPVKIFAQDESGVNRPVCSYVQPLDGGRLITTPKMAARFVSALAHEKASYVGTGHKVEQWQTPHAFLASRRGDQEDHSNLLCSLLLGFGLDAYVCVGLKTNGALYSWVVTRYCDGETVFLWDPITGLRYRHHRVEPDDPPATKQPITNHPFRSVGCLYNHECFYANIQPLDVVETIHFDVDNQSLWKRMSSEAVTSVTGALHPSICRPLPPLRPPSVDPASVSVALERELKLLVSRHRGGLNVATEWDDRLAGLLGPSLASYELERATGCKNVGNEDFQDAIRRAVLDGNTFKGFPVQFLHSDAPRIFTTSMRNAICSDIVECRGDNARLAVRCQATVFPDDVIVTWVMFACRYRSVL